MRLVRKLLPVSLSWLVLAVGCAHETVRPSDGALSDAEIAAVIHAANLGEVRLSELGLERARSETARQFAGAMLAKHTAAMQRDLALLNRLGIQPVENPLSRQLAEESARMLSELQSVTGPDSDSAFLIVQSRLHRRVLEVVETQLLPQAQHPSLKTQLKTMRATIAARDLRADGLLLAYAR
jgi:putative membrane protein